MFRRSCHGWRATLRDCAVWFLALSIPVLGMAATVAQVLGAAHFHRSGAGGVAVAVAADEEAMRGFEDFRRAAPHAFLVPVPARSFLVFHTHGGLERHHHAAGDATVVALGGRDGDGPSGDDAAGSLVIALRTERFTLLPWPTFTIVDWRMSPAPAIARIDPERLERPPKA